MKNRHGMSIPEILTVFALLILITAVIMDVYINASNYLSTAHIMPELQYNARIGMARFSDDIRQTTLPLVVIQEDVPVFGSDSISYRILRDQDLNSIPDQDANGQPDWGNGYNVTVSLDAANQTLTRTTAGGTTILARNVKSVNFFNHTTTPTLPLNEVRIYLELEKTQRGRTFSFNLTGVICLRN